jgi:hypothetical protein
MVASWSFSLLIDVYNLLIRNSKGSILVSKQGYSKKRVRQEPCVKNMKITGYVLIRETQLSFCAPVVVR